MSELKEFNKVQRLDCCGHDWGHFIAVEYDRSEWGDGVWDDTLTLHVQKDQFLPWYKRLYQAVRYVIGFEATKYHYGETVLTKKTAAILRDTCNEFIESPYARDE